MTYVDDRNATADAVAVEMGARPGRPARRLVAGRHCTHQEALLAALTQLGVAYRSSTSEPGVGFDCSGLTSFAWGRAGVDAEPPERLADQPGRRAGTRRRRWPATSCSTPAT